MEVMRNVILRGNTAYITVEKIGINGISSEVEIDIKDLYRAYKHNKKLEKENETLSERVTQKTQEWFDFLKQVNMLKEELRHEIAGLTNMLALKDRTIKRLQDEKNAILSRRSICHNCLIRERNVMTKEQRQEAVISNQQSKLARQRNHINKLTKEIKALEAENSTLNELVDENHWQQYIF